MATGTKGLVPHSTTLTHRAMLDYSTVEGHAFAVVAEAGAAVERLAIRDQVDERGDALINAIERHLRRIMSTAPRDIRGHIGIVVRAVGELRALDAIEDDHCSAAASHASETRTAAREIVAICESRLTGLTS